MSSYSINTKDCDFYLVKWTLAVEVQWMQTNSHQSNWAHTLQARECINRHARNVDSYKHSLITAQTLVNTFPSRSLQKQQNSLSPLTPRGDCKWLLGLLTISLVPSSSKSSSPPSVISPASTSAVPSTSPPTEWSAASPWRHSHNSSCFLCISGKSEMEKGCQLTSGHNRFIKSVSYFYL